MLRANRWLAAALWVCAGAAGAQTTEPEPGAAAPETEPAEPAAEPGTPPATAEDSSAEPAPASAETGTETGAETATLAVVELQPANEAPPADGTAGEQVRLDEVLVTAQKRVESLQKTPVSVTVFNSEKLELRGIEGVKDLGANVPGMTIEPFPIDAATLRIFIRGVGILDSQITQDAAIGVYQDGVYIGRSVGLAFDVADLERIEVLRGPQGTLYGRNTTGGAINIITRRPEVDHFSMAHKLTYGNRNHAMGKSTFNMPLLDDLAVKLAILGSTTDGFVENTGAGNDFGDRQDKSLRFDARWLALDWLTADYSYDYSALDYVQYMYQAVLTPESDHGLANAFKRYAQTQTVYSTGRLDQLSSGAPMEESPVRIGGHGLTLTGSFGAYELKYIGAYRKLNNLAYPDLSGGNGSPDYRLDSHAYDGPSAIDANNGEPVPLAWLRAVQSQWSHELQLTADLFDDQLHLIGGAYYFTETAFDDRMFPVTHQFHSQTGPGGMTDPDFFTPIILANPELSGDLLNLVSPRLVNLVKDQRNDIDNQSIALYTQGTWTPEWLDSRLHLTLGFRHTEDKREAIKSWNSLIYVEGIKDGQGTAIAIPPTQGNDVFVNEYAFRRFIDNSWSGITAFDLTPDVNVYAKYVQAYKSGGFDVRDPQISGDSAASDGNSYGFGYRQGFAPEYVASTEVGLKSEWFDRRLRLNLNLFNMDYTDRQISALLAGTISDTKTRNVGHSRIRGLEFDTGWAVSQGLTLSAEYSFLDAKTLEVLDIDGNNVADSYQPYSAPKNSYVAAVDWAITERSWGTLRSYLSYQYMGARNGQTLPGKAGLTSLDSHGLINLRIGADGIKAGKGMLAVALWGKNLADEEYASTAIDNLPQADRSVIWGEPLSFGIDISYQSF